jgi:hypothetical protein
MSLKLERRTIETETESGSVERFRQKCPHFFKPEVVANRQAKPVHESILPEPKQYFQPVLRKLNVAGGRTEHVMLHLDPNNGSFYFKCPSNFSKHVVERSVIQTALISIAADDWVRIKIGLEVYRLNRAELRSAFHALEKLKSTP